MDFADELNSWADEDCLALTLQQIELNKDVSFFSY